MLKSPKFSVHRIFLVFDQLFRLNLFCQQRFFQQIPSMAFQYSKRLIFLKTFQTDTFADKMTTNKR